MTLHGVVRVCLHQCLLMGPFGFLISVIKSIPQSYMRLINLLCHCCDWHGISGYEMVGMGMLSMHGARCTYRSVQHAEMPTFVAHI